MRDCVGKENYKVGISNLSAEIAGTLGKYLAFTAEVLADFFIAAVHPVMPAHDYNTQCCYPPFVSLLQPEFFREWDGVTKNFAKQKECWLPKLSYINSVCSLAARAGHLVFMANAVGGAGGAAAPAGSGFSAPIFSYHIPDNECYNRK